MSFFDSDTNYSSTNTTSNFTSGLYPVPFCRATEIPAASIGFGFIAKFIMGVLFAIPRRGAGYVTLTITVISFMALTYSICIKSWQEYTFWTEHPNFSDYLRCSLNAEFNEALYVEYYLLNFVIFPKLIYLVAHTSIVYNKKNHGDQKRDGRAEDGSGVYEIEWMWWVFIVAVYFPLPIFVARSISMLIGFVGFSWPYMYLFYGGFYLIFSSQCTEIKRGFREKISRSQFLASYPMDAFRRSDPSFIDHYKFLLLANEKNWFSLVVDDHILEKAPIITATSNHNNNNSNSNIVANHLDLSTATRMDDENHSAPQKEDFSAQSNYVALSDITIHTPSSVDQHHANNNNNNTSSAIGIIHDDGKADVATGGAAPLLSATSEDQLVVIPVDDSNFNFAFLLQELKNTLLFKYNAAQKAEDKISMEEIDLEFMMKHEDEVDDDENEAERINRIKKLSKFALAFQEAKTYPFFECAEVVSQIVQFVDDGLLWGRLLALFSWYVLLYMCVIGYDYSYGHNDIGYGNAFFHFAEFRPSVREYYSYTYLSLMDKLYQASILS